MVRDERMGRSGIRQAMNLGAIDRAFRFEVRVSRVEAGREQLAHGWR